MTSLTSRLTSCIGFMWLGACLAACSTAQPVDAPLPGGNVLLEGEVIDVGARWSDDGSYILTESKVTRADGSEATVQQLGGTVDGIGMFVSHHPSLLEVGNQVRLSARPMERSVAANGDQLYFLTELLQSDGPRLFQDQPGTAAYGINRTKVTGTPLKWASGCIHLSYEASGTSQLPGNSEFRILDEASAEWDSKSEVCSGLSFTSAITEDAGVGRNSTNGVVFREDEWCRPATATADRVCHPANAIAVTQVFFVDDDTSPRDGTILEADMEFNCVNFGFTENDQTLANPLLSRADLRSTTAHELGHVLGLAHNCWPGVGEIAADHDGNGVPPCQEVEAVPEYVDATMFFQQDEGETKKATVEASDVLGVCAGLGGLQCDRVVRSGCSANPGSVGSPFAVAILMFLGLGLLAARRRSRHRARS